MKLCSKECFINNKKCEQTDCRMWIDHKDDLNCCLIAIEKNGRMTLNEVGDRLKISYVRVKQIEKATLVKLQKKVI